jgi:hypothetical protein
MPVDLYEKGTKAAAKRYLGAIETAAAKAGARSESKHVRSLSPSGLARPRLHGPAVPGLGDDARAGELQPAGAGASRSIQAQALTRSRPRARSESCAGARAS